VKIQVNTDKNVEVSADFAERIEADVASALARFERRLTRVEVHLRDESAGRIAGESRTVGQPIPPGRQLKARGGPTLEVRRGRTRTRRRMWH